MCFDFIEVILSMFIWDEMWDICKAGVQSKSSYSKNGEETRLHEDPGVQFQLIF
jgi:hypothetical protein